MTASAGNALKLYIGSSSTPTDELEGANNATFTLNREALDSTDFKTGAYRERIMGLKDFPVSISGDFEPADAAYGAVKTGYTNGSTVYVRILPDGTNGVEIPCKVTSLAFSTSVEGKAEISMEFVSTGDVTFVP